MLRLRKTTIGSAPVPVHGHLVLLGHTQTFFVQIADVVLCLRISGGGKVIPRSHCRCVVLSVHGRQASAKFILSTVGDADVRPYNSNTEDQQPVNCAHVP